MYASAAISAAANGYGTPSTNGCPTASHSNATASHSNATTPSNAAASAAATAAPATAALNLLDDPKVHCCV
jgi:hypothetical protein